MTEDTRQPMNDVIVVLPGILGSRLSKNGHEVWGTEVGGIARNLWSLGQNYKDLELPKNIGDADPSDGVVATGLIEKTVFLPGLIKIDGYTGLIDFLENRFALSRTRQGHAGNLIEFPYDWRLSNRLNAKRLREVALPGLDRWQAQTGDKNAKLILIGHSMGGLISRWFLDLEGGKAFTRSLITLGTPYAGSINAVTTLSNGFSLGLGPLSLNLDAVARSLPALHQLLPTYDCFEDAKGEWIGLNEVDLPNVRTHDMVDALKFHADIVAAVGAKADYPIYALKGIAQPTAQSFKIGQGGVQAINLHRGKDKFGDGTVPRMASHPPEWEDEARAGYFGLQHPSLAADTDIHRQIFGILTADRLGGYMGGSKLGIDAPDLVQQGDPLPIVVRSDDGERNLALQATLIGEDGSTREPTNLKPDGAGGYCGEILGLAPQGYRITIDSRTPAQRVDPVTGFTLVWDPALAR